MVSHDCEVVSHDMYMGLLIMQAFLRAVPSDGVRVVNMSEHMHLLAAPPTCPAHLSSLHEGLVLPQDMCASAVHHDSFQQLRQHGSVLLTALFDISLTGDMPEGVTL